LLWHTILLIAEIKYHLSEKNAKKQFRNGKMAQAQRQEICLLWASSHHRWIDGLLPVQLANDTDGRRNIDDPVRTCQKDEVR
jgi:hypothetical protein